MQEEEKATATIDVQPVGDVQEERDYRLAFLDERLGEVLGDVTQFINDVQGDNTLNVKERQDLLQAGRTAILNTLSTPLVRALEGVQAKVKLARETARGLQALGQAEMATTLLEPLGLSLADLDTTASARPQTNGSGTTARPYLVEFAMKAQYIGVNHTEFRRIVGLEAIPNWESEIKPAMQALAPGEAKTVHIPGVDKPVKITRNR